MSPKNHIISSVPSNEVQSPRTFISYSWSSPEHEARVLQLATELEESGVDVILDKWDLREGADKYACPESTHITEQALKERRKNPIISFRGESITRLQRSQIFFHTRPWGAAPGFWIARLWRFVHMSFDDARVFIKRGKKRPAVILWFMRTTRLPKPSPRNTLPMRLSRRGHLWYARFWTTVTGFRSKLPPYYTEW